MNFGDGTVMVRTDIYFSIASSKFVFSKFIVNSLKYIDHFTKFEMFYPLSRMCSLKHFTADKTFSPGKEFLAASFRL